MGRAGDGGDLDSCSDSAPLEQALVDMVRKPGPRDRVEPYVPMTHLSERHSPQNPAELLDAEDDADRRRVELRAPSARGYDFRHGSNGFRNHVRGEGADRPRRDFGRYGRGDEPLFRREPQRR